MWYILKFEKKTFKLLQFKQPNLVDEFYSDNKEETKTVFTHTHTKFHISSLKVQKQNNDVLARHHNICVRVLVCAIAWLSFLLYAITCTSLSHHVGEIELCVGVYALVGVRACVLSSNGKNTVSVFLDDFRSKAPCTHAYK